MRYPQRSPYLKYKRINHDEYYVENWVYDESYIISAPAVRLLKQLNGRQNPYECNTIFNRCEIENLIDEFDKNSLLAAKKKPLRLGFASYIFPVAYIYPNGISHFLGKACNFFLLLAVIPSLVIGLCILMSGLPDMFVFKKLHWLAGIVIGTSSGTLLHELSHVFAGLSYKARVAEFGIGITSLSLNGYTLIDTSNLKNKFHKVQIYAAGLEMNLLLFGIFMRIASIGGNFSYIAYISGIINLIEAISNALPFKERDGIIILTTLLERDDFNLLKKCHWYG